MPRILVPSFSLFFARFSPLPSAPPPPPRARDPSAASAASRPPPPPPGSVARPPSPPLWGIELGSCPRRSREVRETWERYDSLSPSLSPSRLSVSLRRTLGNLLFCLPASLLATVSLFLSFPVLPVRRPRYKKREREREQRLFSLSPATRDPRRTNTGFLSAQKGRERGGGRERRGLANDSGPLYLDTFIASVLYPAVKVLTAGNS